jgi:hypothetical protein
VKHFLSSLLLGTLLPFALWAGNRHSADAKKGEQKPLLIKQPQEQTPVSPLVLPKSSSAAALLKQEK